jgi:DNA-binding CsgD family transcriptional regulator
MVSESEALSRSIERLYDAAIDPIKWPEALEATSNFVGGGAANLFYQDAATNEVAVFHSWNENPEYTKLYFEKYASLNPYFPALAFVEVGKVVAGADLIPHEEFRQTRFYQEWVKPQNFIDVIGANLDRSATSSAFFSVRRHEHHGIVDDETRRRCELIVPHVRRAVAVGKVVEKGRTFECLLESALERVPSAAAIVTETGRIVFANQKAQEYLQAKNVILSRDGVICAANATAERTLKDAFAAAERGDAALGVKGIEVPLSTASKQKYVAQVLSLSSDARQESLTSKGVAALFISEVTPVTVSPLEIISGRFELTPSEIRVLAVVLEQGGGVREIAEHLGISLATVKTHLNHLVAKTGTRRQADLLRLVAAHAEAI